VTHVTINGDRCQGHGRCALIAPHLFDVDDSGLGLVQVDTLATTDLPDVEERSSAAGERDRARGLTQPAADPASRPERTGERMKTKAAILWEQGQPWSVEEVELDAPKEDEVLVKLTATGLCHSDDHARTGDMRIATPVIGGPEGAGVIAEVGPGEAPGAGRPRGAVLHPACGRCRWCAIGRQNLCDYGQFLMQAS